jgi:methyl-branched lipid omega-hydroxylase
MSVTGIDLSDNEFWGLPLPERAASFARLRAQRRPQFFAEPEAPFAEQGPGYYALVRHADVVEASKHPEVFSSSRGATNIADLPTEFNEYFGSMINMDDPRHARLRRIVSRAFSPRMLRELLTRVPGITVGEPDRLLSSFVNGIKRLPCEFTG